MNWLSKQQRTGLDGEEWALSELISQGYQAEFYTNFFLEQRDIKIAGCLACEVKTARQNQTKRRTKTGNVFVYPSWRWDVSKVTYPDSVLILIAIDNLGLHHPFIMPSAIMAERGYVHLTSHPNDYGGYFSQYLNHWPTVDYLLNQSYRDGGQLNILEYFGMEVTA